MMKIFLSVQYRMNLKNDANIIVCLCDHLDITDDVVRFIDE